MFGQPNLIKMRAKPLTLVLSLLSLASCDARRSLSPEASTDASTEPSFKMSAEVPQLIAASASSIPLTFGLAVSKASSVPKSAAAEGTQVLAGPRLAATVLVSTPTLMWNTGAGAATLWRMSGVNYSGESTTPLSLPSPWKLAAVADFNADGNPDLVAEDPTTGTKVVLYMNGTSFAGTYAVLLNVGVQWRLAAAADFTGDGNPDLLLENTSTG